MTRASLREAPSEGYFPSVAGGDKAITPAFAASSQTETPNQKPNAHGRHIKGQKQIRLERLGPPKAEK